MIVAGQGTTAIRTAIKELCFGRGKCQRCEHQQLQRGLVLLLLLKFQDGRVRYKWEPVAAFARLDDSPVAMVML